MLLFLNLRFLDVLDILLVAYLLYFVYNLVKGSVAINIFVGILSVYFVWRLVSAFQMEMLGEILGQFFSVGVLALIIVFQQEIRQFLFLMGKARMFDKGFKLKNILLGKWQISQDTYFDTKPIADALQRMSFNNTGALIVITKKNMLQTYIETGELINARISPLLIENIFYKNSPLHDGALIVSHNVLKAAKCVLPVSDSTDFPEELGLRHRAAAGITGVSDALAIVVSEQTGNIAISLEGKILQRQSIDDVKTYINNHLIN